MTTETGRTVSPGPGYVHPQPGAFLHTQPTGHSVVVYLFVAVLAGVGVSSGASGVLAQPHPIPVSTTAAARMRTTLRMH